MYPFIFEVFMKEIYFVEKYINPYDYNILWADLDPEYRGYQLSTTGHIRSLKFKDRYPFGTLVLPDKQGRFKLSNSVNKRVLVPYEELAKIANKNGFQYTTNIVPKRSSRNPIWTSESDYRKKQFKKANEIYQANLAIQYANFQRYQNSFCPQGTMYPKFTVINESTNNEIKSPFEFSDNTNLLNL